MRKPTTRILLPLREKVAEGRMRGGATGSRRGQSIPRAAAFIEMRRRSTPHPALRATFSLKGRRSAVLAFVVLFSLSVLNAPAAEPFRAEPVLNSGGSWSRSLGVLKAGRRGELTVSIAAPAEGDRVAVELAGSGGTVLRKELHAGDPDVYLPHRPDRDGEATIRLTRQGPGSSPLPVSVEWVENDPDDADALEAEPNDDWRSANRLILGRPVYGSADDVDWLENAEEGRAGVDWFRFDVESDKPVLVTFTLDLIDRDVSADLAAFTIKDGRPEPYALGKDPMEIVHDRERVRYSKNLVRVFTKGSFYLRVNANHPAYVLRSRVAVVPPFDDPAEAVDAGLHYLLTAGDAWLGQVPRLGNRFVRSANLHETSLRCASCHATSFPAEAALAARRAGYDVEARAALFNMIDRIADTPAPMYGDAGLYWQRFSATPMQGQAAQGGVALDFDRQVADVPLATLERFGPFLKSAWDSREDMPEDERNVVPADSKFGIARESRRLLLELSRRTGRDDYARAAANAASLTASRSADRRVESLQDRIHRLVAWSHIDREANANKIRRETGALLALQNRDGGWHESDAGPGPSAVYATGQLVDALLESGLPHDHPAIDRALKYLLAEQQDFGGWFQPDTHENFRTPMRETRWAVAALARAFPRGETPKRGWGGAPAGTPRTDSVAHALDDLEAAWDLPETDADSFLDAVAALLEHASPLVRGSAAACLGRLGAAESVEPLIRTLDDPSKIVRRAAGFGLRALGNRGIGVDATLDALDSKSPRVRREVVALLNRQVPGFEDRAKVVVDRLVRLADDPDHLARFEAARALRRWFYRTNDAAIRKRIVKTFLARLAVEQDPLQKRNLSENLYILMDENLGGGVSLQRDLAALPGPTRAAVLDARKALERDAILGPILKALRDGGEPQRAGILRAFDGSFFAGRTYARRPTAAVDVGNDREFGFLYEPPLEDVEPVFAALLPATAGAERRDALRLADFLQIPGRSRDPAIREAILASLADPDAETRAEAARIISRDMNLDGIDANSKLVKTIAGLLADSAAARPALIAAVGRSPALARRPEIAASLAALASKLDGSPELLPILDRLGLPDAEVATAIGRGWDRYDPADKARALDVLLRLPRSEAVDALLARAAADPSETIRARAFETIVDRASETAGAAGAILAALADPAAKLRRQALSATAQRASFWDRGDALEALARLIVDPDPDVRSDALDLVKHHRLLARFPVLARRVKALADDPALGPRVAAMLRAVGLDPARIATDVAVDRPLILDPDVFRRDVNPLFYRPGADGDSCVDCHASHAVLRLAERRAGGPNDEDVARNLASTARVVDLARPEASLLLRKPRSPEGTGEADPLGPTGLTHVGGPRWKSTDDPAYRAVLSWLRASAARTEPPPTLAPNIDEPTVLDPADP